MRLSEKSRSAIYQGLASVVHDEEAIEEMLSHFPARGVEELVTKDSFCAELADTSRRLVLWLVSTLIAATSLVIAAVATLR